MDPISLVGAYQGLKAAKEILGTLFDAKVDAESRPKILEAHGKLGEVQDALFMLRERLAELQQERDQLRDELATAKNWSDRAAQYELASTPGSAVVFRFTEQPEHFACPSCFNKAEVQILQDNRVMAGTYRCPGCEAQFPVKLEKRYELPPVRRGGY
jgi:predicted RNA-binding Zn-ribbon protein involved in translation (DUF1610 family)